METMNLENIGQSSAGLTESVTRKPLIPWVGIAGFF